MWLRKGEGSLDIVRYNTLLFQGSKDKEAYICQRADVSYGEVMTLLAPWRG